MRVFLSWSGNLSRNVAAFFEDWIKNVIQDTSTFLSTNDIAVGDAWRDEIDRQLEDNSVGVLFITRENISSPWLNFEAGALSKDRKLATICPVRIDVTNLDLQTSPISKFQSTDLSKEGLLSLVVSLAQHSQTTNSDQARLKRIFDKWWPDFESFMSESMVPDPQVSGDQGIPEKLSKLEEGIGSILEQMRLMRMDGDILGNNIGYAGDVAYDRGYLVKSFPFPEDANDLDHVGTDIVRATGGSHYRIIRSDDSVFVVVYWKKLPKLRDITKSLVADSDGDGEQ